MFCCRGAVPCPHDGCCLGFLIRRTTEPKRRKCNRLSRGPVCKQLVTQRRDRIPRRRPTRQPKSPPRHGPFRVLSLRRCLHRENPVTPPYFYFVLVLDISRSKNPQASDVLAGHPLTSPAQRPCLSPQRVEAFPHCPPGATGEGAEQGHLQGCGQKRTLRSKQASGASG